MSRKRQDLTGMRVYRLTVLREGKMTRAGLYWWVRCDCGVEKEVFSGNLIYKRTKSCGCLKREMDKLSSRDRFDAEKMYVVKKRMGVE